MHKEIIKHNDFEGNPTETDAYFNLTKAEAIKINIRNDLEVIGRSKNNDEILDTFDRILAASYGRRLSNGEFVKEGFPAFSASEAYSELFMKLFTDPDYARVFINNILPAGTVVNEEQGSQADIPEHLRNHPSMQSYKKPQNQVPNPTRNPEQRSQTPQEKLPNFDTTPAVQPPAIATDAEYEEFLRYKASQENKTAGVPEDLI